MGKRIDLTGQRFGMLRVLEPAHNHKKHGWYWKCLCDCGKTTVVVNCDIRNGHTKTCGCSHKRTQRIDLKGKRFGRWFVLDYAFNDSHHKSFWKCRCDCGVIRNINGTQLRAGRSKSCGCGRIDAIQLSPTVAAFNALYSQYKLGAKQRGYSFRLSKKKFQRLTKQNCYYCGVKPSNIFNPHRRSNGVYIYSGIDRVDNSKGYKKDNVVACCAMCNRMKMVYSQEEFLEQVKKIYEHSMEGK